MNGENFIESVRGEVNSELDRKTLALDALARGIDLLRDISRRDCRCNFAGLSVVRHRVGPICITCQARAVIADIDRSNPHVWQGRDSGSTTEETKGA